MSKLYCKRVQRSYILSDTTNVISNKRLLQYIQCCFKALYKIDQKRRISRKFLVSVFVCLFVLGKGSFSHFLFVVSLFVCFSCCTTNAKVLLSKPCKKFNGHVDIVVILKETSWESATLCLFMASWTTIRCNDINSRLMLFIELCQSLLVCLGGGGGELFLFGLPYCYATYSNDSQT